MSTNAEWTDDRSRADEARSDERHVRILLVEERAELADEIRQNLGRVGKASFDIVRETDLVEAAAQIRGERFDLLLMDPLLPGLERGDALELAGDLAHRLPVVVLTGTEALCEPGDGPSARLARCIDHADIASKLLSAIRRSRRLGTGVMTPTFCRIEGMHA